jgi:hypothetical protein
MNITAKLLEIMPKVTGEGKNGTWTKQEVVFETEGQYPQNICVAVWGDKIDVASFQIGSKYSVDFDASSRKYNDRWFTELKAWKIVKDSASDSSSTSVEVDFPPVSEDDGLPF